MFSILLLLGMIYAAVGSVYAIIRHMQMLQQNSYFPSRYFGWLKGAFSPVSVVSAICAVIAFVLYVFNLDIWFMFFTLLVSLVRIYRALRLQEKSIKKLVYTARIKRLLLCIVLLNVVFVLLSLINSFFFTVSLILFFVSPAVLMLGFAINYYPEKLIAEGYVKDAKKILASSKNLKVIGVTGSYGKTSTKFILQRLLSEKYNVVATPGSFNTPMGVVRTIREHLRNDTQIFICEMGAKNVGDIKEICDIVNPTSGIITSVGPQHLETFGTVENVFKTKFELADSIRKAGGSCFVNGDSTPIAKALSSDSENEYIAFGTNDNCNYRVKNVKYSRNGSTFDLVFEDGNVLNLSSPLLGLHNCINVAGAAAVALNMGLSPDEIAFAVSNLKSTEHRLELKGWLNGSVMIDDAYNANPEGCIEALRVLGSFKGMKKIIVTPGLVELGSKEYDFNYKLGLAAANVCDEIVLVGAKRAVPMANAIKTTEFASENMHIVDRFTDAVALLAGKLDSNTVVLIENDLPDNYI